MPELDGLQDHLENIPIPLNENWYEATQDAERTYNFKRKGKLVNLYAKIKK